MAGCSAVSWVEHRVDADAAVGAAGTFAADPATFDVTESALHALQDAGIPPALAVQFTILLRHFVIRFCIEEQALTERHRGVDHDRLDELTAAADPTRFPLTAQATPTILANGALASTPGCWSISSRSTTPPAPRRPWRDSSSSSPLR
jgi:hypothetical protein